MLPLFLTRDNSPLYCLKKVLNFLSGVVSHFPKNDLGFTQQATLVQKVDISYQL